MDFELDDDQLELQRVVRDVLDRECPPSLPRAVVMGDDDGAAMWKTFVDLDWPGLAIAEEHGGSGFGVIELVLLLEELGRAADPTPLLATTSQFVPLIEACGDADQRARFLAAVCRGDAGAVAWARDTARVRRGSGGWLLEGSASVVLDGDRADEVAVVASNGDDDAGDDDPVVAVVPAGQVTDSRSPAFDGTIHVADLDLAGVSVPEDRVLRGVDASAVTRARDVAVTGIAASTVGASQRVFELALAHLKERHQFGVPIGSFQALKHMAVDVFVAIERARALCHYAGLAVTEGDARRSVAASMAKSAAGDAQRIAFAHGIQFFGGLGFTWENDLQLYARRAKAGELLLGSSADHRAAVARNVLAEGTR